MVSVDTHDIVPYAYNILKEEIKSFPMGVSCIKIGQSLRKLQAKMYIVIFQHSRQETNVLYCA